MKKVLGVLLVILLAGMCVYGLAETKAVQVEKIELSSADLVVYAGKTARIRTAIEPANVKNKRVNWESSNPEIATVSNGNVVGKAAGECDIICKAADGGGAQAVCHVTVRIPVKSVKINEKNVVLLVGGDEAASSAQLTYTVQPADAFFQTGEWASSRENVVTVDENGLLHAMNAGNAVVTFTSLDPGSKKKAQVNVRVVQAVTSISLDRTEANVPVGKTLTLKAAAQPSNAGNKKVNWTSSDERVAKVTTGGRVQGVAQGMAVITATASDGSGKTATCTVNVVQPVKKINVAEKKVNLAPGTAWTVRFYAEPSNATINDIEWSSSNTNVATVDAYGLINGVSAGSCRITGKAVDGSGVRVQIDVRVQNYEVVITSPKAVTVDFATSETSARAGIQIGNYFYGEIYETKIKIANGCVECASDHTLKPVKAGPDKITITETHNRRKVKSETHTVYVAQSAVENQE